MKQPLPKGTRDKFKELGAEKFAKWVLDQKHLLLTDTTFRDAHQSLLGHALPHARPAQRRRCLRPQRGRPVLAGNVGRGDVRYVAAVPQGMPVASAGRMREKIPNILFQMLLRRQQRRRLHELSRQRRLQPSCRKRRRGGIDVFRIFDSLNWVPNMRVAMEAVLQTGAICEAGDLLHRRHPQPQTHASTT